MKDNTITKEENPMAFLGNAKELVHLSTCLPDYFQGHTNYCFAIPIHKNMTVSELKEAILESGNLWEPSDYDGFTEEEFTQAVSNAFSKYLIEGEADDLAFPHVNDNINYGENDVTIYAYYTVA